MYNKHLFILMAAGAFATSAGIVLIQVLGVPLKDFFAEVVLYAMIGMLIAGYLLRLALVYLVVLAIYESLRKRFLAKTPV